MFEWTWWVLLSTPLAWWLQATLHESSHLVVGVRRNGITPLKIVLWPHVYKNHFYGARLTYYEGKHDPKGLMHIAPMWVGLKMMLFIGLLMLSASPHIRTILAPFWIVALFHVLSFWRGYFWGTDVCDGKRWRKECLR